MAEATTANPIRSVTTLTLRITIVETDVVTANPISATTQAAASSETSIALSTSLQTITSTSSFLVSQSSGHRQTTSSPHSISTTVTAAFSTTSPATLPAVYASSSGDALSPLALPSWQSDAPLLTPSAPTATVSTPAQSSPSNQKHAIVSGLSGAIAGLVLIGVIAAICLKRRIGRRPEYEDRESISEKGFQQALSRKWMELTGKGTPREDWQSSRLDAPVTVDEDHHIIRMSTRHWPRPYAQGHGEGWRESQAPGTLRVVNPDASRPTTPARMLSDLTDSALKKPRSSLVAAIAGGNRSRTNSQNKPSTTGPARVPDITTIDPALSRECIAPMARAPSFTSYPLLRSSYVVTEQSLGDPFLAPPEETAQPRAQQRPKRPSLAPVQTAASAATRTLSSVGSALNPFRARSDMTTRTSSTWSSRSNPFEMCARRSPALPARGRERDSGGHWTLYEGT